MNRLFSHTTGLLRASRRRPTRGSARTPVAWSLTRLCLAPVLGLTWFAATAAWASTLPVGGTVYPVPTDTTPPGGSPESGNLLATTTSPFSSPAPNAGLLAGNISSYVINSDPQNPYGPSALTFVYEVQNTSPVDTIDRLTVTDYTGYGTDVAASSLLILNGNPLVGGPVVPTYADRTTADVVGFNFTPAPLGLGAIVSGSGSYFLVVRTDATSFTSGTVSVLDGFGASTAGYAPAGNPVPEPGSCALCILGAGFATAHCLSRRRARLRAEK